MEIERFNAEPVEVAWEDKVIKLMPLKKKNLHLFIKMDDATQREKALDEIINITLKESGLTDEEIEEVPIMPVMKAILRANGIRGKEIE